MTRDSGSAATALRLACEAQPERAQSGLRQQASPKIRLFINYPHIALVMRRRRELGIGERVVTALPVGEGV